ncbi:cytochrome P450 [Nonomuraea sp. NN258]|uniref:cytochrome P450 n=1 Tax=Nonomuraea antri TaxID=2730852 RepID=UPI001568E6BD|nr:cytochrome P450 [Nonomuraea antri]NRQ38117.1 cytochrome P450 [Nonomuraea antri]
MSVLGSLPREQAPVETPAVTPPVHLSLDHTLGLLLDPYGFVQERARELGTDIFETRLLLRKTTCMTGADAAAVFYDQSLFERHQAAPRRLMVTLFGQKGVQSLDGERHRARKALFMSIMTPLGRRRLSEMAEARWRERIPLWAGLPRVVLYEEVSQLLCQAVCDWTGVVLTPRQVPHVTSMLQSLIEGPAALGPRYLRGRIERVQGDRWAAGLIRQARARPERHEGTVLGLFAGHRDTDGRPLPAGVAAVELLNVLRPTVAVARFITFAAMALHADPRHHERIRAGDETFLEYFVQEVRRFYPFFPMVAAKVATPFDWRGHHFPRGRRVLLDLQGIDHDPRLWERPCEFRPERFAHWDGGAFDFVPQGGGDHYEGHRCPGEWITIDLMKVAVTALTRWMTYRVPAQDLRIQRWRAPAIPNSRFVINQVSAG